VDSIPKASDLAQLSLSDRLDLLDQVWASLRPDAKDLPVPDWHVTEIADELSAMTADDNPGKPLEQVVAELKRKL
jgi:hypothetical protein